MEIKEVAEIKNTNNRNYFNKLLNESASKRVQEQRKAKKLLFEGFETDTGFPEIKYTKIDKLIDLITDATEIILPEETQQEIYNADTGTHAVPQIFKKALANIKSSFVFRPGNIRDLKIFCEWAFKNRANYTIRGAGTWPFGGCVPLNNDIVVDLSNLDFMELDEKRGAMTVGAGAVFSNAKKFLLKKGWALKQEISNGGSGTICGWIATGGLGIGSYKYGTIRNSVKSLLILTPKGKITELDSTENDFEKYFGSEGHFGVIAGAVIDIRKNNFVCKPYAFSFKKLPDAHLFIQFISESSLKPTSVIYFSETYIKETYQIENRQIEERAKTALENNDQIRLREIQEDRAVINELKSYNHVVVLHFDEKSDYELALKSRLFGASGEKQRVNHINYWQLSTPLAHLLWDHRFLSVKMKQNGPSLLVSETILPLKSFSDYEIFLKRIVSNLLNIELKSEAHLLPGNEILIQSLFLSDTRTLRHKLYFALVPLMSQVGYFFGARPYGIGMWNSPAIKEWRQLDKNKTRDLILFKKETDKYSLINQGKFLNPKGQIFSFRVFRSLMPRFLKRFVETYNKRIEGKKLFLSYPVERLGWRLSKLIFPRVIPPDLRIDERKDPLAQMISVCAECDSCERVCPTSEVFGQYGAATPITRRKTAERLIEGEEISQQEALGFLACTRCDNCVKICPTNIPLTNFFDLIEEEDSFQRALNLGSEEKESFLNRFWKIMKESPLYIPHTLAEQKENRSHLEHGLKIIYEKGFKYASLFIDSNTCIHCGMCGDESSCMYGARQGKARQIPELLNVNCALCNACVNFCPQNKIAQEQRQYFDKLVENAVDFEEKKYWIRQQNRIHDTTKVIRSDQVTEMSDKYVTEEIIMEIDKEASTGKIPVSGSGQGDRHMGIGFDAERFAHFHIVGPAQNRLHEGDPDEELSIILGKREDFCKFDRDGNLVNPLHPNIKLMTPILYNTIKLESNGKAELAFIKVAEEQKSLVVITLERMLEHYDFILKEGGYEKLPEVIIPRVDHELINQLIVNPKTKRDFLSDLWRMPIFEVEYYPKIERTLSYIKDSVAALSRQRPLFAGYIELSEHDLIGSLTLTSNVKEKVNQFLDIGVDILHLHGQRNKEMYFVTSKAVRALHHYLTRIGRRHEVSIIASGGIRLASDSQKTIQRGAEGTLIDFSALLALDPTAYKAIIENKTTTEKLLSLEVDWAVRRLNNQAESRKVQILEVLGASGFKDIKKTVGEEGRLIDFHKLENRIQRNIFENDSLMIQYRKLNKELVKTEALTENTNQTYSQLKRRIKPVQQPHNFYRLGNTNQKLYKRDFVWPGQLIQSMGKMASGDLAMLDFKNVKGTGLLGDGFDVMQILYNKDPMDISETELENVKTALPMDKGLVLKAPWMFGGKSVGSIGLDTWKAHVIASKELGIQFDTGEGGYPTCFFLNSKGEPIFFTENEIQLMKPYFTSGREYPVKEIAEILEKNGITRNSHPEVFEKIKNYPTLKPFQFVMVVDKEDEPFVSTELKTGLFGVTKQTIKKARRVVIAYSQGAKMGIGGHILAQKVNKLVSYMRGVEGMESLNNEKVEKLFQTLQKISNNENHKLKDTVADHLSTFDQIEDLSKVGDEIRTALWEIQEQAYLLFEENGLDPIEFETLIRYCEEIIEYSYSSIISPFPFHNCYSIEDVKAFIDVVRMINPDCVISIKVSPSIDIEFIASGLGRIAKDNTEEILQRKFENRDDCLENLSVEMTEYAEKFGMKIEIWLDGPRGGTGASPNIIKGQMGMHLEYAIPLIHNRLVNDGLRNYVKFIVSGGIRTYEDVIKAVALGADGVIWGTAPLVAIGCDRNRNCHDGCSRGIATSNLALQKLRDIEVNTQQIINAFTIIQMQVMRALAALGYSDIRQLRGRFDKIHWIGLKERVDHRFRVRKEVIKEIEKDEKLFEDRMARATGQTNCGVAAVNGNVSIPGHILDQTVQSMRNRGMDGVGIAKTLCFPGNPDDYAYRIMVKGVLQTDIEKELIKEGGTKTQARQQVIGYRTELVKIIKSVFLDPYFDFTGDTNPEAIRENYKTGKDGKERDYREFGNKKTDPGDIFNFFIRVKQKELYKYIENDLLRHGRPRFLEHLFPEITIENYKKSEVFLQKAEDLFVLNHSHDLTRILYVSSVLPDELEKFAGKKIQIKREADEFVLSNISLKDQKEYFTLLRDFMQSHAFEHHKHRYGFRSNKIAAVMSCGKNFAIWKTAGREIPWQTPDAPNNIIHVRLATGSDVEQMNAHPFAKLHTALTHNGETTNYEALRQRVEQFNLSPLASTDTEVASLKFHLTADEWEYPDWALFESFSPTTGDDLQLVSPKIQNQLEEVQRVEFASSPDGPYQYLCLRHNPYRRITERVDLKDPADLRPNVSAFWYDTNGEQKRIVSIIASEEHAVQTMLELLDKERIIAGSVADLTFLNSGMISRYYYDAKSQINDFEFINRYGNKIELKDSGNHYSVSWEKPVIPETSQSFGDWQNDYQSFFTERVKDLSFAEFRWLLSEQVKKSTTETIFKLTLVILTWLKDYIRTINPGQKAQSSLVDIIRYYINELLDSSKDKQFDKYFWCDIDRTSELPLNSKEERTLIIDCSEFMPEGIDADFSLASFLKKVYGLGYRKIILYKAKGQRLISTAVMGDGDTDDVELDVYGAVGEYFGAFMQGGIIRLHGNAQNFCGMGMHHGELYIFGNAGKVCGYASKGGKVFIMGNVVDRCWTNSVNDSRCQNLEVKILGSATKYGGESLMGGDFFFGGLNFDQLGNLRSNERPYLGTKMFGGASRGNFLFFDPEDKLVEAQYIHGIMESISDEKWEYFDREIRETFALSNIKIYEDKESEYIIVNGARVNFSRDNFKLIVPRGGLKGYESH